MKISGMPRLFITSTVLLLVVALIEKAILSNLLFLPAVPDLSMICILFISLHDGRFVGESTGFISGLLLDFLGSGPFGLNCFYRTLFGYLSGALNKILNTRSFFLPLLFGLIACAAKALLLLLVEILFPFVNIDFSPFTWPFVFECIENTVLTPFFFMLLNLFDKSLILKPESIV